MISNTNLMPKEKAIQIPVRLLAHLGDAVFHVFERQCAITAVHSVGEMHELTTKRAQGSSQASLLEQLSDKLSESEQDLVRRARNIKGGNKNQNTNRASTAFEALIGYLYLSDPARLAQVLEWTKLKPLAES